jgi:hypothetical protein
VDPQSNSGVYLRGRYEIQILDGYGRPLDVHSQGALYGFIVPAVNADKPAGEWQTYEITLIANRVTVILNGTRIIDNGEVPGITGEAHSTPMRRGLARSCSRGITAGCSFGKCALRR